jgi:hypothetical protein
MFARLRNRLHKRKLRRQDYSSASDEDGIDLARRSLRAQTAQLLFGDGGGGGGW